MWVPNVYGDFGKVGDPHLYPQCSEGTKHLVGICQILSNSLLIGPVCDCFETEN